MDTRPPWIPALILGLLLAGLLVLAYLVLESFLGPLAWAGILVYATWPLHVRLRRWLRGRDTPSAAAMTMLLLAAIVLPGFWLASVVRDELTALYGWLTAWLAHGPRLPEFLAELPWLGSAMQELLDELVADPAAFRAQVMRWTQQAGATLIAVVGEAGRNALALVFSLLTAFFFYRDGENIVALARQTLARLLGERAGIYINAAAGTVRAVVYGLLLTALVQGVLAGVGYWIAGLNAPVLLAITTALAALLPFGTPFVWVPAGVWLIVRDHALAGIGLLVWGAIAVSSVDNLIRPLVISRATRIPFLLVMFGVFGGLLAFGAVGLFLGPVILAVLLAVWREWLKTGEPAR